MQQFTQTWRDNFKGYDERVKLKGDDSFVSDNDRRVNRNEWLVSVNGVDIRANFTSVTNKSVDESRI